jgi:hypothetical protein
MYQMAILLLYNHSREWTVERMQDETQMKTELLLPVLGSLLESKLLTCKEFNGKDVAEVDIKMNPTILLTNDFKRYIANSIFDITAYLFSVKIFVLI